MMSSSAYLGGSAFDKSERLLVRTSLRILLAWQVSWFLYTQLRDPSLVRPLYYVVSAGTAIGFIVGVIGLARMRLRTGRLPPTRALVAWLALFVWYAMLARDPKALFWIQIAHAIQYLAFPIRVEMNRADARAHARAWRSKERCAIRAAHGGVRRHLAGGQLRRGPGGAGERDGHVGEHVRRAAGQGGADSHSHVHQRASLLH
jgi:hypothetical protein